MTEVLTERELEIFTDGRNQGYERGYAAGIQAEKRRRAKVKAAVCAAVEAFQAAEQEVREARVARDSERLWKANNEHGTAKARLLEVNLG